MTITARKRSLGQGNIFAPVCHSVHSGEYLTPPPRTRYNTQSRHPPGPGTSPRSRHPPGTRYTPRSRPPAADTPRDQVHPPRADNPGSRHPPRTRYTPQSRHPPGPGTPLVQSMLGDMVNKQAVHILLECNLVYYMKILCGMPGNN